ncbi:hypothetical protein [Bradyrhizobium yuanmingense]|uniref:hypothetical protein n=1 Tax=Bradyrhizobium yuanmingense TaxID=108015 RepID=UPI0005672A30|nr:hypothetical protein [Bradyrhizobium yuanmingense]
MRGTNEGTDRDADEIPGFSAWKWEDSARRSRPSGGTRTRRCYGASEFPSSRTSSSPLEVVNEELRLGLLVDVERVDEEGIVGTVDFEDRRRDLAAVERRIAEWGPVPRPCRSGPILDRLLACAEFVMAPDRLEFGGLKRECIARFRNDGALSLAVQSAHSDENRRDTLACAPAGLTIGPPGRPARGGSEPAGFGGTVDAVSCYVRLRRHFRDYRASYAPAEGVDDDEGRRNART